VAIGDPRRSFGISSVAKEIRLGELDSAVFASNNIMM